MQVIRFINLTVPCFSFIDTKMSNGQKEVRYFGINDINVYQRLIQKKKQKQKNVYIHEVLTVNQNRRSQHQNISWFWTGKITKFLTL